MKNILLTGGAGFIGSNFIPYFLDKYPGYQLVNLDKLTYAGNLANLKEVISHPRHQFIHGDITNRELVNQLFQKFDFQGVIHIAAESHVDKSIEDPTPFVKTNIEGTFILLEAARLHWMQGPNNPQLRHQESRFLYVSTDEVYGSLGTTGVFTEESPYAPNNPYSATKAAGDLLARSYVHTYGLQVITTHATNTYGPKQYPEKLVPKIIHHALSQQPIPIHGQGTAIRDWLYVLDHCKGIDLAFHHGKAGEHYNLGSHYEQTNLQIAHQICSLLDELVPLSSASLASSYASLLTFVADRPGNDQRYALATHKANTLLGWKAEEPFNTGIRKTIQWYIDNYSIQNVD